MTESPEEVEALRARLSELEARLAAQQAEDVVAGRSRRDRQWWRSVVVGVLVTIAALLAPLTVVATWARDQVGDTDRFVETVTPLASDPAVTTALSERITSEINSYVDAEEVTADALTALAGQEFVPDRAADVLPSLAVPLSNAIENFVGQKVDQVVHSDTFQEAWVTATREAHAQMVNVLTGETSESVDISEGGAVSINIATFVETVKQRLIDEGFNFATRIPEVDASFTIFTAENIGAAQKLFGWLDTLARVLPILALLLLFAAVMVARDRRKTLLAAGLAIAASMVLLGLTLNLVRPVYLDAVPPEVLPGDAAAAIYDTLVQFIRQALRALGIVALGVALAAFWFAPTGAGAAMRQASGRQLGRLRDATGAGRNTGPVGQFLGTYRTFIRVVVVSVGALVYVGIDHPTAGNAVTVIVAIVLALIVVELVAVTPEPTEEHAV